MTSDDPMTPALPAGTPDPVRALLLARGCPPAVIARGLPGLVASWEDVVATVGTGYALTLDDYQNDMDLRSLLAAAVHVATDADAATVRDRLTSADAHLMSHTVPCPCLWGDDIAEEEGLDAGETWWYFRRPARPGPQLEEDLATWGLL
jgi:hypothetical protein